MGGIRREREDYIPTTGPANRHQKILAKEAIVGLLKNGKHTPRDIAEHFGIGVDVVSELVEELVKAGRVDRVSGKKKLLGLKNPQERRYQGK